MSILVNAQEHREAVSKGERSKDARRGYRTGNHVAQFSRERGLSRREAFRDGAEATGKESTIGVPIPGVTLRNHAAHRAAGKLGAATGAAKGKSAVEKGLTNGDVAREVLATPKPRLFGKKRDAAERTRARGVLANPKVAGAEDDYWLKADPVSKGLPSAVRRGGGGVYGEHLRGMRENGRIAAKAKAQPKKYAPYADVHQMGLGRSSKQAGRRWLARGAPPVAPVGTMPYEMRKSAFGVELLDEVEKAFPTAKIGGATFTPLALGAGIGVGMRRRKKAAQGADDSKDEVEKGLGYGKLGRKASTAAKDTIKLEFKKPKPGVTPTGPGSQRGSMSASAWESRTAAARRSS